MRIAANDKRVPLGRQPVQEGAILAIQQGAGVALQHEFVKG